jgi:outer membrane protein OmpA-like peptidoglycan-associated protein
LNLELSQNVPESVKNYLMEKEFQDQELRSRLCMKSKLIATNATAVGRAKMKSRVENDLRSIRLLGLWFVIEAVETTALFALQ